MHLTRPKPTRSWTAPERGQGHRNGRCRRPQLAFTADKAVEPSGVYRAAAQVRGAELKGGWIVLQDGSQVGIVSRDGKPAAAPPIDPATGAVTVDGTQLTARPVVP